MKWFDMWFSDKECILETMVRNMAADLDCGYDYFGNCIRRQREEIDAYREQFDREVDHLKKMEDEKRVERWCYMDLRKRGAIA